MPYSESLQDLISSTKTGEPTDLEIHYGRDGEMTIGCIIRAHKIDELRTKITVFIAIIVPPIKACDLNETTSRMSPRRSAEISTLEIETRTGVVLANSRGRVGNEIKDVGDLFSPLRSQR